MENEDWLISPPFDMDAYMNEVLHFESATNYDGIHLELKYSTDYDGESDPSQQGTWTDITDQATWSETDFNWVASGDIDLSSIDGSAVYLAFVYNSTPADGASEWSVDNFELDGQVTTGIAGQETNSEISMYPNPAKKNITVEVESLTDGRIMIFNVAGEKVCEKELTESKTSLPLPDLKCGVYTVHFYKDAKQIDLRKLVVR